MVSPSMSCNGAAGPLLLWALSIAVMVGCGKSDRPPPAATPAPPPPKATTHLPAAPVGTVAQPAGMQASAIRRIDNWSRIGRSAEQDGFPKGTVKRSTTVRLSGGPPLVHDEFRVPPGKEAKRRWDHAVLQLPDGSTLHGNSLAWVAGQRNFSPWSFLYVRVVPDGADKPVEVLKPSLCTAAAAAEGDTWASAQLTLERPLSKDHTVGVTLRFKRVAGDPYLYMLVLARGGTLHSVTLSGFPNHPHPIYLDGRLRPRHARFVDRRRWVWAAGHDWDMHERKQDHAVTTGPDDPGGVFFYNRLNSQTGGMQVAYVPGQVKRIEARGTYGVSVTLGAAGDTMRLALKEWNDMAGWPTVRERFVKDLPARARTLATMNFAWPMPARADAGLAHKVATLITWTSLDEASRSTLRTAWSTYLEALGALGSTPLEDTPSRYHAEVEAWRARDRVDRLCEPLVKQFVKSGDLDALVEPSRKDPRP